MHQDILHVSASLLLYFFCQFPFKRLFSIVRVSSKLHQQRNCNPPHPIFFSTPLSSCQMEEFRGLHSMLSLDRFINFYVFEAIFEYKQILRDDEGSGSLVCVRRINLNTLFHVVEIYPEKGVHELIYIFRSFYLCLRQLLRID